LYAAEEPGGNRKADNYWYRYIMYPKGFWVGVNANIALAGIGLLKAAAILDDASLKAIARKQLDWIIGFNPFSSSTIVGVGHNQLPHMDGSIAFRPPTPVLPGAVMNGLTGDSEDRPYIIPYDTYNDREYWMPAVACTLWLMGEITMKN
jgi:hypothetical protein